MFPEGLGPQPPRGAVRGHELGSWRPVVDAVVVVKDAAQDALRVLLVLLRMNLEK